MVFFYFSIKNEFIFVFIWMKSYFKLDLSYIGIVLEKIIRYSEKKEI